ncbi:MAG TPA: metalloregulator ArsR/SmtB family transcription factor [Gemmatimonadales bacterium]|jgi:DNA-binding transcriptional ArsR family regulator
MVNQRSQHLDAVFHALSDPTRRGMLRRLARREWAVTELAAPYDMSLAAASKHIKVLEHAGLVHRTIQGRTHICRLASAPLATAHEWLDFYAQFWTTSLDILEGLLSSEKRKRPAKGASDE